MDNISSVTGSSAFKIWKKPSQEKTSLEKYSATEMWEEYKALKQLPSDARNDFEQQCILENFQYRIGEFVKKVSELQTSNDPESELEMTRIFRFLIELKQEDLLAQFVAQGVVKGDELTLAYIDQMPATPEAMKRLCVPAIKLFLKYHQNAKENSGYGRAKKWEILRKIWLESGRRIIYSFSPPASPQERIAAVRRKEVAFIEHQRKLQAQTSQQRC